MKIDKKLTGKAIAMFREKRGLTQAELNAKVGMSTVQHIEQGRNAVSLDCLNKIAEALDVPAACIALLGSTVGSDDKVLESLQSLLRKTIKLDAGKATKVKEKSAKGKKQAAKKKVKELA